MWQPIETHKGLYEVSRCGEVRRVGGSLMGQWKNSQGYMIVRLSSPRTQVRVHRLVAMDFIKNPNSLPFVNHIDSDRANNNAENLEWCTQWTNIKHASDKGRMQKTYWIGKRSPNAKLSTKDVIEIRKKYKCGGISWERLGKIFCVSKRTIGRIVRGEHYANLAEN